MWLFCTFLVFAIWGAGMTPVAIALARHYGMVDCPDARKIHHVPMPRGAGLVLWCGMLMWILLFANVSFELRILATGGTVVFFVGYIDDMLALSPYGRLMAHFFAAALALLTVEHQSILVLVVLLFWMAGLTNAYNFIDGVNGLSLSMAFLSLGFMGLMNGFETVLPMIAMIVGVFFWNFPKAKTFLGDGGVYLLGYFTAGVSMHWLLTLQLGFFKLCLMLFLIGGIPVYDTLFAIARRLRAGKSPFYPDRSHIHHHLLDRGLTPSQVLCVLTLGQFFSLLLAWLVLKV